MSATQSRPEPRKHLMRIRGELYNADAVIHAKYDKNNQILRLVFSDNRPVEVTAPEAEPLWQWLESRVAFP